MQHIMYIVKNSAGEYLCMNYDEWYSSTYIDMLDRECLIDSHELAIMAATRYNGTVKRITIIEEED